MIRKRLPILATLVSFFAVSTCAPAAHAAHLPHSRPVIRVGIVLFDGVEPIDYAGPYETFAQAGFAVSTVSANGKAVTGMGLEITPDYSFANAPPFDAALHILARLKGVDGARSIAIRMEYAWQPDPKAGFVRGWWGKRPGGRLSRTKGRTTGAARKTAS